MGYVLVLPEFGLVADPVAGVVTTAGVSYQPVIDQVAELEKIADDLVNMLSGEGNYLNRQVTGDYENFKLPTGVNSLRITGTFTSVTIDKYSRWI